MHIYREILIFDCLSLDSFGRSPDSNALTSNCHRRQEIWPLKGDKPDVPPGEIWFCLFDDLGHTPEERL